MSQLYFQRFSPNYYNNDAAHNHNLRHQALRLPMTRKEYYVQSTKYQLFKGVSYSCIKINCHCVIVSGIEILFTIFIKICVPRVN